ncbi:MAG: glycosyltransferase family 39 protein, partial [candidate division Zixibacteria bacterium]|nr:glycosyltransferase family 39 protein [candidate division Zixibacteria bacterium]
MTREERRQPVYLFLLALAINGIALALSQNYLDGDAHTRTYMALQWLKSPFFIYQPNEITWVFGPLHCYLNALILSVWNNPTLAPRLLSLVLTTLTIFPFYHSVRIVFSRREAFYTTLLFCFYTLFIHPAAIAVGEGINLLLVFLSIWLFLRCRESGNRRDLFLCALTLMLASAMRYESWLLPPFFVLLFLFHRYARAADMRTLPFLHLGAFALLSHAFILMWMISCWATWGDPVYFLHYSGNLDMPVIAAKIEQSGILKLMLYNLAFLPAVMLLSFPVT